MKSLLWKGNKQTSQATEDQRFLRLREAAANELVTLGGEMPDLKDFSDEDLLTACLWAEARGEPEDGQKAVCNVIVNRVRKRMAPSIRDVILKPKQFSWTDPNDVNYKKVFTAMTDNPESWERAHKIARAALDGLLEDMTKNADHYLNIEATKRARGGTLPKWAQEGIENGKVTVVIGNHTFLNLLG